MKIRRKIRVDVRKTVENSVCGSEEFHFYVDELTSDNLMPTYQGMADEKYSFKEMDDGFFEFLNRKASEDGIFIRLVFAERRPIIEDEAVFEIEYGVRKETFRTGELDKISACEFADFGIRVKGDCITLGMCVEEEYTSRIFFAELGSADVVDKRYVSLDNPLNRHVIPLLESIIVLE